MKLKKILTGVTSLAALALPLVTFAITTTTSIPSSLTSDSTGKKTLASVITLITGYLNQFLFLFMGVAVVMFVFYVIKYYFRADADRAEGAKYVMYSIIGFFVILSFWGIVNILQNTFGLQNDTNYSTVQSSYKALFPQQSQ